VLVAVVYGYFQQPYLADTICLTLIT